MRRERAKRFRDMWARVPVRFWEGVWVGWRRRMDWVRMRMAALFRRGWKAKREVRKAERRTEDHIRANRRREPAWAMGAVPIYKLCHIGSPSLKQAAPGRPRSGSSSGRPES